MSDNLKSKTKKGLVWSMIERFATQGVQFLFGIILARLLSPRGLWYDCYASRVLSNRSMLH